MPKAPTQPAKRGRPSKTTQTAPATKRKAPAQQPATRKKSGPFELSDSDAAPARRTGASDDNGEELGAGEDEEEEEDNDVDEAEKEDEEDEEGAEEGPENTIPTDLLTRLLHDFFEKGDTRMTRTANDAAAKYVDVFVREAIARCVHERPGGFLEVEDLEKIAPQLLMDF